MAANKLQRYGTVAFGIALGLLAIAAMVQLFRGMPILAVLLRFGPAAMVALLWLARLNPDDPVLPYAPIPAVETSLAHWSFSPEQWSAYIDRCCARQPETTGNRLAVMFLAVVFGAFLAFLVYHIAGAGWPTLTIGLPVGLTVTIGLWPTAKRKREWLLRMAPEVWIGRDGLLLFGKYTAWFGPDTFLKAAQIDSGELAFDLRSRETGAGQIRVPIPPGEENAAAQVALKLTELCALE